MATKLFTLAWRSGKEDSAMYASVPPCSEQHMWGRVKTCIGSSKCWDVYFNMITLKHR